MAFLLKREKISGSPFCISPYTYPNDYGGKLRHFYYLFNLFLVSALPKGQLSSPLSTPLAVKVLRHPQDIPDACENVLHIVLLRRPYTPHSQSVFNNFPYLRHFRKYFSSK